MSWDRGSHAGQTNGKHLNQILHVKHKLNHISSSLHLVSFTQIDHYLPSTLTLFKEVLFCYRYMYVLWIIKGHMTPVKVQPLHEFLEANIFLYIPWSSLNVCNKKLGIADAKKILRQLFQNMRWNNGKFFSVEDKLQDAYWLYFYLCLHHGHPLWPHFWHQPQDVNKLMIPNVLQEPVQGDECSRPADTSAARVFRQHIIQTVLLHCWKQIGDLKKRHE